MTSVRLGHENALFAECGQGPLVEVHADQDGNALPTGREHGRLVVVAGLLDGVGERVAHVGDLLLVLLLGRGHVGSVPHGRHVQERVKRYDVHEIEGARTTKPQAHQGLVPCAHSAPMTTVVGRISMKQHPLYDDIRRRLEAGESDLAIERALGISRATAGRYRKQLGIAPYRTNAASTHCRHGHPFNTDNEAFNTAGHRYCRACVRNRQRGRRRTWTPVTPDEIAIERAIAGDPPERLTPRERAQAVLVLRARQVSAEQAAERVGCTPRTVWRIQARYQDAA